MHQHEELLGADYFEHDIRHPGVGVSRAVSVLKHYHEDVEILEPKGQNEGKLLKDLENWNINLMTFISLTNLPTHYNLLPKIETYNI